MKSITRPKSLTENVAENLRYSIVSGELSLGQPLSEASLSETFNVSKTPVREALFILKQEGLIDIIPQKGSFVFKPDEKSIVELCNFRSYIEPIAIAESIKNNPQEFLESLEICIVKMEHKRKNNDFKAFLLLDGEFHESFFKYCDNSILRKSYQLVQFHIGAIRSHLTSTEDAFDDILEDHRKIYQLLSSNNVSEAQSVLQQHVLDIKSIIDACVLNRSS
ncbi:Transcriptional regulator, GntR family protein [Vibrio coralliirubri]|uniref:Transcriptional regulator, GntR family protein n=1 Tax=Vibrio coralliirubri TaxID=1516159 RepID=A0AA86WR43_9VIBR|nr:MULTISPECIES: GntR family transcriptional regulator [Vibrio]UPR32052.1 GntR family transcriptional regulator [Vibrio crassostreae]CDT80243.1 Transcriptional regulator, GntR family protein [Vibrio coralliirubri]